jgi:hypothetical protein
VLIGAGTLCAACGELLNLDEGTLANDDAGANGPTLDGSASNDQWDPTSARPGDDGTPTIPDGGNASNGSSSGGASGNDGSGVGASSSGGAFTCTRCGGEEGGCYDLENDIDHCGACAAGCPLADPDSGFAATCIDGGCGVTCKSNYATCRGSPDMCGCGPSPKYFCLSTDHCDVCHKSGESCGNDFDCCVPLHCKSPGAPGMDLPRVCLAM